MLFAASSSTSSSYVRHWNENKNDNDYNHKRKGETENEKEQQNKSKKSKTLTTSSTQTPHQLQIKTETELNANTNTNIVESEIKVDKEMDFTFPIERKIYIKTQYKEGEKDTNDMYAVCESILTSNSSVFSGLIATADAVADRSNDPLTITVNLEKIKGWNKDIYEKKEFGKFIKWIHALKYLESDNTGTSTSENCDIAELMPFKIDEYFLQIFPFMVHFKIQPGIKYFMSWYQKNPTHVDCLQLVCQLNQDHLLLLNPEFLKAVIPCYYGYNSKVHNDLEEYEINADDVIGQGEIYLELYVITDKKKNGPKESKTVSIGGGKWFVEGRLTEENKLEFYVFPSKKLCNANVCASVSIFCEDIEKSPEESFNYVWDKYPGGKGWSGINLKDDFKTQGKMQIWTRVTVCKGKSECFQKSTSTTPEKTKTKTQLRKVDKTKLSHRVLLSMTEYMWRYFKHE